MSCVILFLCVFFSSFSIAITSLGEERANLRCFSYVCSICACLVLSVSSSSWVWEVLRHSLDFSLTFFFFNNSLNG